MLIEILEIAHNDNCFTLLCLIIFVFTLFILFEDRYKIISPTGFPLQAVTFGQLNPIFPGTSTILVQTKICFLTNYRD